MTSLGFALSQLNKPISPSATGTKHTTNCLQEAARRKSAEVRRLAADKRVLGAIGPDSVTVRELSERLGTPVANLGYTIRLMQGLGYIEICGHDRITRCPAAIWQATPKGIEHLKALNEAQPKGGPK